MFSVESKEELNALGRLGEVESKVRKIHLQAKIGEHDFLHDANELFQAITKAVRYTSNKLRKHSKATFLAIKDKYKNFPVKTNALANTEILFEKALKGIHTNYAKDLINDDMRKKR